MFPVVSALLPKKDGGGGEFTGCLDCLDRTIRKQLGYLMNDKFTLKKFSTGKKITSVESIQSGIQFN